MSKQFIYPLKRRRLPKHVGGKAQNLYDLYKKGFAIPLTFVIPWDLHSIYHQNGEHFPPAFLSALTRVIDPAKTYAVRSSANVEDSQTQSYAGQFLSLLNVSGPEGILDAIRQVWASSHLETARIYQDRQGNSNVEVKMGVIIQEMIPAQMSGVAFSRNPITGLDEVVVEAVKGSGVALVQDGITPERWIWKWGKWLQQPNNAQMPERQVQEIVKGIREISQLRGEPIDAEWAFVENRIIWLQTRVITAFQDIDIYANHISKEMLPGLIKPLVWSVNIPLVNGAWIWMLTEIIGDNQLDPLRLARRFYGHAYFNMGLLGSVFKLFGLPENALERLMGFDSDGDQKPSFRPSLTALRHFPRSLKFGFKLSGFGSVIEAYLQAARREYAQLESQYRVDSTPQELASHIEQLYNLNQRTASYNIISSVLMRLYHKLAQQYLSRQGVDYTRINWLEGWEDRTDYDPIHHLRRLGSLYRSLDPVEREMLGSTQGTGSAAFQSYNARLQEFLDRFGHLSDSGNDFSYPSWQETPEVIFNLVTGFTDNSNARRSEQRPNPANVSLSKGHFIKQAVRWSRYREEISFLFTRGVSMFRQAYQHLGTLFHNQGWLAELDDIFYLERAEIVSAVRQGMPTVSFKELVRLRKAEYAQFETITPPPIIYGDQAPPIVDQTESKLQGIPASRGVYRGVVQVVKGLSDFSKCVPGCVLVIPYSDVSWTPLFARAGAIVAEAGGLLSHSAIIAREFGIPAIVSVPHAVQLEDGTEATVDGFTGNIILHNTSIEDDA